MENTRGIECVKNALNRKWSTEQISERTEDDYHGDCEIRVSHQTIYDWIRNGKQHGGRYRVFLRQSSKEFAEYEPLAGNLNADIYFAKPYHSEERGLNENTNALLRQYFPTVGRCER